MKIFDIMDNQQATSSVLSKIRSRFDTENYNTFIRKFPGARFYRNDKEFIDYLQEREEIKLPAWMIIHLTSLAGAFPGEGNHAVSFSDLSPKSHAPIRDFLSVMSFKVGMTGWPSNTRQKNALKAIAPGISLFPIGNEQDDPGYHLAINLMASEDTCIYQYHIKDVMASVSAKEDPFANVYMAFESPSEMLANIQEIYHGGISTKAVSEDYR